MNERNVFDNRQTQTRTAKFTAAGFIHPVEAFKKPVVMFRSNTYAVIFDRQNCIGTLLSYASGNVFAIAVTQSIFYKVYQCLFQKIRIS